MSGFQALRQVRRLAPYRELRVVQPVRPQEALLPAESAAGRRGEPAAASGFAESRRAGPRAAAEPAVPSFVDARAPIPSHAPAGVRRPAAALAVQVASPNAEARVEVARLDAGAAAEAVQPGA